MTERNQSRPFDTEAEAWAFREGVEMVNDIVNRIPAGAQEILRGSWHGFKYF